MSDSERRENTKQDESPEEPTAETTSDETAGTGEDQSPEQDGVQESEAPPPDMNVFDVLRMSLGLFAQEAWIGMGLQTRPGASETSTDLRSARIAIDVAEVIAEKLGEEADEDERRTINQILTDLRVNFVRVSSRSEEQENAES